MFTRNDTILAQIESALKIIASKLTGKKEEIEQQHHIDQLLGDLTNLQADLFKPENSGLLEKLLSMNDDQNKKALIVVLLRKKGPEFQEVAQKLLQEIKTSNLLPQISELLKKQS